MSDVIDIVRGDRGHDVAKSFKVIRIPAQKECRDVVLILIAGILTIALLDL